MDASEKRPVKLSRRHLAAFLDLGDGGPSGEYDTAIMSDLLTVGLVEIRSEDRQLALTELGRRIDDRFRERRGDQ